jgi:uncharacterized protein YndB with AHSA1/START domain
LLPGFRPAPEPLYTAVLALEPHGTGTRYTVTVMHAGAATREDHEQRGLRSAWGTALDQLEAWAAGQAGVTGRDAAG